MEMHRLGQDTETQAQTAMHAVTQICLQKVREFSQIVIVGSENLDLESDKWGTLKQTHRGVEV